MDIINYILMFAVVKTTSAFTVPCPVVDLSLGEGGG